MASLHLGAQGAMGQAAACPAWVLMGALLTATCLAAMAGQECMQGQLQGHLAHMRQRLMPGLWPPVTAGSAAWPLRKGACHPALRRPVPLLVSGQRMVLPAQGTVPQQQQGTARLQVIVAQDSVAVQDQGTVGLLGWFTVRILDRGTASPTMQWPCMSPSLGTCLRHLALRLTIRQTGLAAFLAQANLADLAHCGPSPCRKARMGQAKQLLADLASCGRTRMKAALGLSCVKAAAAVPGQQGLAVVGY